MSTKYRGYTIIHDPPPVPFRSHDYQFAHDDWDLDDPRIGSAGSIEGAKREIDEIEECLSED